MNVEYSAVSYDDIQGVPNVPIYWFVASRPGEDSHLPEANYPMLEGYDYTRSYVLELFTPDELKLFREWMAIRGQGIKAKPEDMPLSTTSNWMGMRDSSISPGLEGCIEPVEDWSHAFKVAARWTIDPDYLAPAEERAADAAAIRVLGFV